MMFHVYMVRKGDDKYFVRLVNSVVSSTGIKTSAILNESKVGMFPETAVDRANALIDAFINAGMSVEPALNLSMEEGVGHEG